MNDFRSSGGRLFINLTHFQMENDRKLKFNALEYDFRLWIYYHNGGVLTLDRLEWPVGTRKTQEYKDKPMLAI